MPRPTKLTPDTQERIVQALMTGATIVKTCAYVGIGERSYYRWLDKGKVAVSGRYWQFWQEVTHAQAHAHTRATGALASAMLPSKQRSSTTETTTETKLRTITHKDGTVEQVPYEATISRKTESVTDKPPDWRAAVEFLKRRDSANWSATQTVNVHDWRMQLLQDIQSGILSLDAVIESFGGQDDFVSAINEPSLAARLFATAGLQLQDTTGTTENGHAG